MKQNTDKPERIIRVLIVCIYFVAIFMAGFEVYTLVKLVSWLPSAQFYVGSTTRLLAGIILVAIIAVGEIWFFLNLAKMIRQKNMGFLQYYHNMVLLLTASSTLATWIVNGFPTCLWNLIGGVAGWMVFMIFARHTIMKSYIGSSEYTKIQINPWKRNKQRQTSRPRKKAEEDIKIRKEEPSLEKEHTSGQAEEKYTTPEEKLSESSRVIPAFQKYNCCICNSSLEDGYSVFFTSNSGMEARIDKKCRSVLRVISKCENPEDVHTAEKYIQSHMDNVSPIVAQHLSVFLLYAADYLKKHKDDQCGDSAE